MWKVESNFGYTLEYATDRKKVVKVITESGEMIDSIENLLEYVTKSNKVLKHISDIKEKEYVTAINCTKKYSFNDMMYTKMLYQKTDKILAWHGYQSFLPGEVTPDEAHEIGVKLAKKLFGDRFEVVVTTHLDKAHIHNHIVVNSVSFVDGKKLYWDKAFYYRMREESDKLCLEYGKSIVENPRYNGMTRGAYRAMKEGRYNLATILKEDIDYFIAQSVCMSDFLKKMADAGYRIDNSRQYLRIYPYGHTKAIRIDRRYPGYDLEGIAQKIEGGKKININKRRMYANNVSKPLIRIKGYKAIYIRYLYMLGKIPSKKGYRNSHYLVREELTHIGTMNNEMRFMIENKISTAYELETCRVNLQKEYDSLNSERNKLRNRLRRCNNIDLRKKLEKNKHELNQDLSKLRKQLFYCKDIKERSEKLNVKMEKAKDLMNERGGMRNERSK